MLLYRRLRRPPGAEPSWSVRRSVKLGRLHRDRELDLADLLGGPVLEDGAADDVRLGERPPDVAVVAVVAVVAHHEHVALRDQLRGHGVSGLLRGIGPVQHLTVHQCLPVLHLHNVACRRHNALDEHVVAAVTSGPQRVRGFEDDHLALARMPLEVCQLLSDKTVTNVKGGVHGEGWDESGLSDERPYKQRYSDSKENCLRVLLVNVCPLWLFDTARSIVVITVVVSTVGFWRRLFV
mmetsp:Transcript_14745/g.31628  ORF Transcript_14745/g.31628 Transcript_14745/m.31628 type:complete len:237 (-) Transcript_14745:1136-1846(-)